MDQIHRIRVNDLIEIVPYFIDMIAPWSYLIQTVIFNQDLCNISIWSRNIINPDTIKYILSTIKIREPDAFKN